MKPGPKLQRLAERFDEFTLRERAMIFGAAALLLLGLASTLLLDPLAARRQALSHRLLQSQGQLQAMQEGIQGAARRGAEDPDAALRARLDGLRREEAALSELLAGRSRQLVAPERVPALLEDILSRNRGLQLVSLRSLPAAPLGARPGAASGAAGVFRHGVEVVVRGGYFELLGYVAELEKLPWQLYWGDAVLSVEAYPVSQLTFTLYTLSLDRTWLRI